MLIDLQNINVLYGEKEGRMHALKDVSLQIEKGEFVTIVGKSGCGKSTLLNILGGIRRPDQGNYLFDGKVTNDMKEKEKAIFRNKNVGFVVQHFALIQEKTVYDNIMLPLNYQRIKKQEKHQKVQQMMEWMEIAEKKYNYPYELSGGQCQRVAIARALVTEPQLILADEPTGAMDEENAQKIVNILKKINEKGTTIIMVTHDMDMAKQGKRCIHMKDGRII